MRFIDKVIENEVAILTLSRGKVNALNGEVVDELRLSLEAIEHDPNVKAVVITARGAFFSFGFDIPELLPYSKPEFVDYLVKSTDLYTYLFLYPKPVVAALNGHTIAAGCMLALAADYRVMAEGRTKIGLNEISFGSTVFAGSTEILRFWVGSGNASKILYSGALYRAEEAKQLGLVHEVAEPDDVVAVGRRKAADLASKPAPAFASIKSLLRKPIAEEMKLRERESIQEAADLWYSASTRANLEKIQIR